ncbi:MAG: hypothetical protein C0401_10200 [Anaerolinea sp.]|nr:hypothetical protein [Anaerolinea sp.]
MKKLRVFPWFCVILLVVLLATCSGTARQTATPFTITYPTAQYTDLRTVVENANGKIEMGMADSLPSELPRDVPIYYPGFPTGWTKGYSNPPPYIEIGIEAGSEQASVVDWYRSALESNGWTIAALDADLGSEQCGQEAPQVMDAQKDLRMLRISVCASSCPTYTTNCSTNVHLFYRENH